jgi:hypothetical protein
MNATFEPIRHARQWSTTLFVNVGYPKLETGVNCASAGGPGRSMVFPETVGPLDVRAGTMVRNDSRFYHDGFDTRGPIRCTAQKYAPL